MRAHNRSKTFRHRLLSCVALGAMAINVLAPIATAEAQALSAQSNDRRTRTPIKHLIVVVGENRGFDNVFATYVPNDPTQSVWNLLSQGIIDINGNAGPNVAMALQQQATDTGTFQLAPPITSAFPTLPQPSTTLSAIPYSPCLLSQLATLAGKNPSGYSFCNDPGLPPAPTPDPLLTKGGTGQPFFDPSNNVFPVPDCRYPSNLPNAPYSLVGASVTPSGCTPLPFPPFPPKPGGVTKTVFSDNTGDPVHRFFQMWQQNHCANASRTPQNPSGCLHDLYTWVATSVGWQITQSGNPPTDDQQTFQGGIAMGFYNMAAGDYPIFQSLAQQYAISDNYHQPVMGGTGANSQFLMTGDVFYYTDAQGNAATPPPNLIENPDPQANSNNFYTHASPGPVDPGNTSTGGLVNCSDPTQPGVAAIRNYLNTMPYHVFNRGNCARGHFYQVDNEYPYYDHLGNVITQPTDEFPAGPAFSIGPQTIPTIGDSLAAANISWKYYGEGFNNAASQPIANELYCAICNGFQYSRSIMTGPLKNNLQDLPAFFADVSGGTLPAVSFVKPDILLDSHPGTSTPPLFEAFVQNIIQAVQSSSSWDETAILITFDESGGYYDSGYIQPIDFFGDGPRTVLIAVSPFAKPGFVDHTYADHASILKFIEHNWRLKPLSNRSRDNLPNPRTLRHEPYFPRNAPAIGDLTTMFQF
jgi:phospholipase C